jgi:hypothetical protein
VTIRLMHRAAHGHCGLRITDVRAGRRARQIAPHGQQVEHRDGGQQGKESAHSRVNEWTGEALRSSLATVGTE